MLFEKDVQGQCRNIICVHFVPFSFEQPRWEKVKQVNFILNLKVENDNVYPAMIWYLLRAKFEEIYKGNNTISISNPMGLVIFSYITNIDEI